MARVRLMSSDGLMGLAAASRLLKVNISTLKLWCDREELVPDAIGPANGDIRQFCGDWCGLRKIWAAGGSPAIPNPPTPDPSPGIMQWRAAPTKSAGPPSP